jgi:hypothetical protein
MELQNEIVIEGLRDDFYNAVGQCDWDVCRIILSELEDMKVSTYELRRDMNTAMDDAMANGEPADFSNSTTETYGL